jgi:hypothetical protein
MYQMAEEFENDIYVSTGKDEGTMRGGTLSTGESEVVEQYANAHD